MYLQIPQDQMQNSFQYTFFGPTGPNVFPDPTGSVLYCLITQDQNNFSQYDILIVLFQRNDFVAIT